MTNWVSLDQTIDLATANAIIGDMPAFLRRDLTEAKPFRRDSERRVRYVMPETSGRLSVNERDRIAFEIAKAVAEGSETFGQLRESLGMEDEHLATGIRRARTLELIDIEGRRYSRTKKRIGS